MHAGPPCRLPRPALPRRAAVQTSTSLLPSLIDRFCLATLSTQVIIPPPHSPPPAPSLRRGEGRSGPGPRVGRERGHECVTHVGLDARTDVTLRCDVLDNLDSGTFFFTVKFSFKVIILRKLVVFFYLLGIIYVVIISNIVDKFGYISCLPYRTLPAGTVRRVPVIFL